MSSLDASENLFRNHRSLMEYIGKRVRVQCELNRIIVGELVSTDRHCNVLLKDAEEDVTSKSDTRISSRVKRCMQTEKVTSGLIFHQYALLFIRGSAIGAISRVETHRFERRE